MSTFDVVLTGWETWGQWHRMVKLKAMCCGFQQYIDIDSKNPPPLPTPPEKVDEYIATGLDDRPLSIQIYKYELAKKEYDEYRRKSEEIAFHRGVYYESSKLNMGEGKAAEEQSTRTILRPPIHEVLYSGHDIPLAQVIAI
ncbi:hypothetical protein FQN53_000289 [Emmonsiellopsis sp. PD_33]|nr:hypothetical protein FQN53_000289 [Emmonsiellopsis sp. PD_33]